MLDYMSAETDARLARASRRYTKAAAEMKAARAELAAAVEDDRREGTPIEEIAAKVPVRQGTVNRWLDAAGLTQKRSLNS